MKNLLKRFTADKSANFGVILSIAVLPIALAAGIAVDYTNASRSKTKMQNAADSAALAAALEFDASEKQRKQIARDMIAANFLQDEPKSIDVEIETDKVTVTIVRDYPTSFMGLIGINSVPVKVDAEVAFGITGMEVALVLDVSGSMNATLAGGSSRIAALKSAASKMIADVKDTVGDKGKFSVVPFTMNVNVGKSNVSFVTGTDHALFDGTEWKGCVQEKGAPYHVANNPSAKFHAYIWPPSPNRTDAGICKNPSNGTNSGYSSLAEADSTLTSALPFGAQFDGPNRNCVRHEILPLTNNRATIDSHLASLTAEGNDGTIIAPGVTWGLRTLSPEWPFKEGAKWEENVRKYMVILTDGAQTTEIEYQSQTCNQASNDTESYAFDPANFGMKGKKLSGTGPVDNWTPYGFIADSDPFSNGTNSIADLPDTLMELSLSACAEAKKSYRRNNIEVFTIGVSDQTAPGTKIYDLLNKCASKPENHFYVTDSASLEATFKEITREVKNIHLLN